MNYIIAHDHPSGGIHNVFFGFPAKATMPELKNVGQARR
jgi:hypothetical protein